MNPWRNRNNRGTGGTERLGRVVNRLLLGQNSKMLRTFCSFALALHYLDPDKSTIFAPTKV